MDSEEKTEAAEDESRSGVALSKPEPRGWGTWSRRRRVLVVIAISPQVESEYLGSPTQIVTRARSELGMQYRTLDRTIFAGEIE